MIFREKLEVKWAEGKFVCVGLDTDFKKIPPIFHDNECATKSMMKCLAMSQFNELIVDQTRDLVCAYKPNFAFYGSEWTAGFVALERLVRDIRRLAPDVTIILDAKVGDIGNTNLGYVRMAFEQLNVDAITVHPYLGQEALQPFLDQKEKGIIVLCRTSNPGAGEFQDLEVRHRRDGLSPSHPEDDLWVPMYKHVAHRVVTHWNTNGNCALVVGATYPDELREVREIVGNMPILIPGVGKQGGKVEEVVPAGKDSRGMGMIINSSSAIIFAENPRAEALKLDQQIRACLTAA